MPKQLQVGSLYSLSLNEVNNLLCSLAHYDHCTPNIVTHFKSNLHRNIREELLAQYNGWYQVYNFNYMKLIIDCTLKNIVLNECLLERAMSGQNYIQFMKYLNEQQPNNLCNLSLLFKKYPIETPKLKEGNYYLCQSLNNGMARNLHTVILPFVADNCVLQCLGQHCTQLVYLDISNSWNIDEDGILNFLFKNPEELNLPVDVISSEMDPPSECLLDELTVPDEELNPVCFTMQEIRMQDTNTSPTNLFIILLTIKRLKSLGGYLYFRSVGDAIVTLKSNNPSLQLNLTHLWDAHLPPHKLDLLAQVLPDLTHLNTRVSNLPFKRTVNTSGSEPDVPPYSPPRQRITPRYNALLGPPQEEHYWPFRNVTHLTLDFDFFYYDELFHSFLKHNGHSLVKLVLVDQPYNFNLLRIYNHCPKLVELNACVYIPDGCTVPEMSCLKSATLTLNCDYTLHSVFAMFPCIEQLTIKIRLSWDNYQIYHDLVHVLRDVSYKCFKTLLELRLHFVSDTRRDTGFGVPEAIVILEQFEKLQKFGNFDTWEPGMNLEELETYVKSKMWDVELKTGFDKIE
uniref:Uncharacterized protein n=1 Tax=Cacopsylla melanoneura TaxID=428564 RepID=A0A8D8UQC1_9HEMI